MYLRHPRFLTLSINGQLIENLCNPFNKLILANAKKAATSMAKDDWCYQVRTNQFALQLLSSTFTSKLQQGNHIDKALIERGL